MSLKIYENYTQIKKFIKEILDFLTFLVGQLMVNKTKFL